MSDRKTVPVYQSRRQQVAGVEATLKVGDDAKGPAATWLVRAASLGRVVPKVGDRCRGTDGVWWRVATVGALVEGAWELGCEREAG